jgi:hypothetical protein
MKRILLCVLTIPLTIHLATAQITSPVTRANFGVEADLRANFFNGSLTSVGDDWFNNGTAGTGQFIIDTTGAAAIMAGYISNPATRMLSFSRLMRQAPYSVVNNRLLLDAIFTRDFHGDDSTVFAAGSNKNGMSPANWSCPISQGIPDKNDILDAFAHARRAGPNITDSLWLFGGVSIVNTTGNRYFDFELYQTDFYYDRPARVFRNYGPDAGHTSWIFNPDGTIQRPGDIIFTAEYGSSSLTLVEARIWVSKNDWGSVTPAFFNWGGLFDGDGASATYGYASILPKTAGAFYTGLQCGNGVWPGPFNIVLQDNSIATSYIARQFMEFSVNMTKLGLDPAYISTNGCSTPFRRMVVKTRASTAFTAELKDFVAPFRMFDYPMPQAVAQMPIFCGEMGVSDISILNPNPTSTYNWSTTNGNILGSTTGPIITVDTIGTYTVAQYLHSQCPAYAYDTVNIIFDSLCVVLDKNLISFTGTKNQNTTSLYWDVLQNERIQSFDVEYSLDNNRYSLLENIISTDEYGAQSYNTLHNTSDVHAPVIFYRLRLKGTDNRIVYSNVIAVRLTEVIKPGILIYPNPSSENVWASVIASKSTGAEYVLADMNSKIISTKKVQLHAGNNTITLSELDNVQPGVYFIKMFFDGNIFTQKIIITK